MKRADDIIAAIATPVGEGGLAVIRASGTGAVEMVDRHFRGNVRLLGSQAQMAHVGYFVDGQENVLDEVVATVFREPHSYTGEDVVEVSCHGGVYVTRKILEAVIASGARLAEPGEFTKRAFLNGRIDLSQAEAVADLIRARSRISHRSSLEQLRGSLSSAIRTNLDRLTHACGLIELELDFVEEGITLTTQESLRNELDEVLAELRRLSDSFEYGRFCREGVKVVLVGRPNVGKSSLLNRLLDRNRAIVTEVPGTTRDVIEENITINGMLFRVVDTAGVRETRDVVEKEGVERTKGEIMSADVCAYVVDQSREDFENDREFVADVRCLLAEHRPYEILLANKSDLSPQGDIQKLSRILGIRNTDIYGVSAYTGDGIELLKQGLGCIASPSLERVERSIVVTSARHKARIDEAIRCLQLALQRVSEGAGGEVVAIDVRDAVDSLGAIVGKVTTEDLLNAIFSEFCIGK